MGTQNYKKISWRRCLNDASFLYEEPLAGRVNEKKAYALEHLLLLFVLVLPSLVGMKNQIGSIRNLLKSLVQHSHNHIKTGRSEIV